MKKLLFFLLVTAISSAQQAAWFKPGYSTDTNYSSTIAQDAAGNVVSAGTYGEHVTFGGTTLAGDDFGQSIFIVKYDANGQQIWAKSLLGNYVAQVIDMEIDLSGNIFIIGDFADVVDFDPSGATHNITLENGTYVAKYSPSGNLLWVHAFELSGAWVQKRLTLDSAGNVYFAGSFGFEVDFDPSSGTEIVSPINGDMPFLASYDTNGAFRWVVPVAVSSGDIYGAEVQGDTVFLAGYVYGEPDFDPTTGVDNGNITFSFVSKYSTSGNYISAFGVGNGDQAPGLTAMTVDDSGNIFVAGYMSGTTDFDPSSAEAIIISEGSNEIFIAKYTSNGNYVWAKVLSGDDSIQDLQMTTDANGNVAIAGLFQGNFDVDPGENEEIITSVGFNDGFLSRLDANGEFLDNAHIGSDYDGIKGDSYDRITGIILNNNTLYVSGGVAGPFDFDENGPLPAMTFDDNFAIQTFLVKYSVTPSLSVPKSQIKNPITAWPNPANHIVTIENVTEPFSLYDVFGQCLAKYPSTQTEINVSTLLTGTYILKSGKNSTKILKN